MKSYSAKIVSLVLLMTMLTACSNSAVVTETTGESTTAFCEATETAETTAVETTEETTVETNVIDNFTVETVQYTSGVEYTTNIMSDMYPIHSIGYDYRLFVFGYDNYRLQQNIIDYVENETGQRNENLTAANIHSFQFGALGSAPCSLEDVDEAFWGDGIFIRTILSRLGLRFMIDEIPAWFFEENYPELTEWYSNYSEENEDNIYSLYQTYCSGLDDIALENLLNLSPEAMRLIIFNDLCNYNDMRSALTLNYYAGDEEDYTDDILQVRDEETGRFVLVPTEEQYYQLIADLHEIPTYENVDLIHPETEEELSSIFDVNTEELIPYDMFTYESQTFSYVDGQVVRTLN